MGIPTKYPIRAHPYRTYRYASHFTSIKAYFGELPATILYNITVLLANKVTDILLEYFDYIN